MTNLDRDQLRQLRTRVTHDTQIVRLDQVTVANGGATGARYLIGRTIAGLGFRIAMDRGFDIEELSFRGQQLGWHGPMGATGPGTIMPDQEDGRGPLRAFSGFMITCGYDFFGPARTGGADHFGYGLRETQHYPLHGRASFLRADLQVAMIDWEHADGPTIVLQAEMRQAGLFGENLVNRRRIEIAIGTARAVLTDTIRNDGMTRAPHQVLYHINLGAPLIGEGTRIDGLPEDPDMPALLGPLPESMPESFRFEDRAACAERVSVTSAAGTRLSIHPDSPAFRRIGQWWNHYAGMECIGIEPASADMPAADAAPWEPERFLAPGESETYRLVFEVDAVAGGT